MVTSSFSFLGLAIACVMGVAVGSFLNVILTRFRSESFFGKRDSMCLSCGARLKALDLFPVLSYLGLRGRCRTCGSRFSDAPVVEIVTACLFGLVYITYGLTIEAFVFYGLMMTVVLISMYDIQHKIVPDEFSVPFILFGLLSVVAVGNTLVFNVSDMLNHLLAGIIGGVVFYALWYFSKGRAMGFADGILGLGIGLVLGWPGVVSALVLAFWIGAIVSVLMLAAQRLIARLPRRKRKGIGTAIFGYSKHNTLHMKSEVPFGPFLMAGFVIILFTGWRLF